MNKHAEIRSMLTGQPSPKPVTLSASVRIPVSLLATITAMANRANVSRNEMFSKLLAAAVDDTFVAFHESRDGDVIAEIQADADEIATAWLEQMTPEEHEDDQE